MKWYIKKICCDQSFLGHIYSWKIVKLSDFMFSQGGGTHQFGILQGGGTCA